MDLSRSAEAVRRRVAYLLGDELSARWDDDQQLSWAGLMEISRVLPARHDREMIARHGLSLTLLGLLGRLAEAGPGSLHARELAVDLDLSAGRVSRHLATLEQAGLLDRATNRHDGRALDVALTDAGRGRLAAARRTAQEIVERDFLALVTPEERAVLARVAEKILRAAEVAGPAPGSPHA